MKDDTSKSSRNICKEIKEKLLDKAPEQMIYFSIYERDMLEPISKLLTQITMSDAWKKIYARIESEARKDNPCLYPFQDFQASLELLHSHFYERMYAAIRMAINLPSLVTKTERDKSLNHALKNIESLQKILEIQRVVFLFLIF